MADVESNIHVNIDTSDALASLKLLQRQISAFHTQMAKSGTAAAAVAANQAQNLMNSINATGQFQASMRTVTTSTEHFTDALERNKLTSREYFRYTGAATKTFGKLFRSEFETINKVARERVKDIQTQYIKLGRGANGALQAIAVRPLTLDMKNLGTQTAIAAQRQQLLNQLLKQGSTNLLNFGKNTQWAGRQLMVGFTVPLAMLGTTAAKTFMKLEEQAIRFKRVYGEMFTSQEETDAMVKQIQTLAKEYTKYGVAVEETMKMAADAAAMGKQGAELTAQVVQATRLAVLGGVEQTQALETTISVTNAFGVAAEDLAKKIDFLNAVENQTVVSIEDLTIAIPKAGPVVQQLGGDVEDLAFFLTAMKEGGINASEGANALKSGLASLINPSKKASAFLGDLGVNITGIVEANKGDIKATVVGFAQALDTLDPLNRARAIEQLFGKFQFSRLSTLFQNVTAQGTQAQRVLALTQATTEELSILSQRELDKIQNTTTYKFKKSMEDLKVAIAPVGEQFLKALTPIVEFVGKILDKFNNLGDGSKKFLTIFTVAVAGIGPVLLMTFGLIANAVANIIKMFASMKSMYNRTGGASKVLGEQTNYLTKEQLEASAVAASLDQVHQRLRQTFTSEATAVNALANAYKRAIAAQMGFTGPAKGGKGSQARRKYSTGTTRVPGSGNQDTVPSMLTPGEAVIPAEVAQDPRFKPIISAMVNKRLQGFNEGTDEVTQSGKAKSKVKSKPDTVFAHATGNSKVDLNNVPDEFKEKAQTLKVRGFEKGTTYTAVGFDIPESLHKDLTHNRANLVEYLEEIKKPRSVQTMTSKLMGPPSNMSPTKAAQTADQIRTNLIKALEAIPRVPLGDGSHSIPLIGDKDVYSRMGNIKSGILGGLARDPRHAGGVSALLAPQGLTSFQKPKMVYNSTATAKELYEAVEKSKSKPNTKASAKRLFDHYPGQIVKVSRDAKGNIIAYERPEVSARTNELKKTMNNAVLEDGAFKGGRSDGSSGTIKVASVSGKRSQAALLALQKLEDAKAAGKPITKYREQLSVGTGFSNVGAKHLSGVHITEDGRKVYVKPMIDEKSAMAELRATRIAREVHGLETPKQELRLIQDPITGKTMYALESEFNPKFDPETIPKKFSKKQYIKQLLAAGLRGDKDLKRGNLGGNVLTDVGPAGVFSKASGARDYAEKMPSLEEMTKTNLSGVKGDAAARSPFWFGNQTADIAKSMSAEQFESAMKKEVKKSIANLEKLIPKLQLSDAERPLYTSMLDRLKEKVDWKSIHKLHTSIAIKPDEVLQDDKTGKITKPKTEKLPANVKSSAGKKDKLMTQEPEGKSIVQGIPKKVGRFVMPGKANAPEARVTSSTALIDGARGSIAEAKAVGANIGTNISQSAAAASRTLLYGTGPIDAEAKSVRRQLEKQERVRAKTQARINANKTSMYGTTGLIDPVMRGKRKQAELAEKRSRLAEKVAYQQQVISERAAAEAKRRTPSGRIKAFVQNRQDKRAANLAAGKQSRISMGGALGVASGAAMIGSMAPGKVGEISQKVMMPLMGLSMILPMLKSPTSAVIAGLMVAVGSFVALRMAFDKAADQVLQEGEKFKGSSSAIQAIAEFSGKVTASEQMDLKRKNSFSMLGPATGKTSYGEAFVQTEEGKALTGRLAKQSAAGKGNEAAKDLTGQLSASLMSGAIDMSQAKSLAMNAARQAGDMSIGIKVIAQLESLLGPNGENLVNDPLNIRINMINENKKNLDNSIKNIKNTDPITKLAGRKNVQIAGIGASALGGAAAGAGIGGMIGGPIGAVIGAGIGTAAGAVLGFLASKKFAKRAGALGAAYAVDAKIAMEQNKELLDSFDLQYQKKIELLRTQGKINEAEALQTKYINERDKLTDAQGKLQGDIVAQYDSAGGLQESMMNGMKKATAARYKNDPNQLAYTPVVDQQAADLVSSGLITKGQEFLIQAKMASGDLPPSVLKNLLFLATDNTAIAPKIMEIITKFSGATAETIGVAAENILDAKGDVNTTVQTEFVTRVQAFEKDSDALDFAKNMIKLNNLNTVIPSDVLVSYYTNESPESKAAYEKLNSMFDQIETKKNIDVPFVYDLIPELKTDKTDAFDEKYFDTLTDDQKKTYTYTVASLINVPAPQIVATKDYQDWLKQDEVIAGKRYGGGQYKGLPEAMMIAHYTEQQGFKAVVDNKQVDTNIPGNSTGTGTGSKVQASPLDDLVKKLRDVRKNQIKVTEGWAASRKALDGLFGGKKTIDVFSGIENDLRGLGGSQDFIELIVGMDPKEYEKRKNSLFKFDNKGNIIGLKRDAKNIQEALNSITMGEWNSSMESETKAISDQSKAMDKLSKLGVPVADAYELVSNKAYAQAIANGVTEKSLGKLITKYNALTVAQKASASIQDTKTATSQLKNDRLQEQRLKQMAAGGNGLDAFAISSDNELKALEVSIFNQKKNVAKLEAKAKKTKDKADIKAAEDAAKLLAEAEAAMNERITELKKTVGLYEDLFNDLFSNVMDSFDAEERKLQIDFEMNIDNKKANAEIEKAQNEIAAMQYLSDDKEAALKAIEDQEQAINEKYDKRIEALDAVEKANANIANQQKGQLTLAEALTSGDIAAAARAAQEMRAQEAADAVTKQKDAVEQSRKYELSTATGFDKQGSKDPKLGQLKTRKQLEKEIKEIQDKIFEKEEAAIEPQQEFLRLKQIALKEDIAGIKIAGLSREAWEQIQSNVEIARIRALDFVKGIESAMKALDQGLTDLTKFQAKDLIAKYGVQTQPVNTAAADRAAAEAAAKAAAEAAAKAAAEAAAKAAAEAAAKAAADKAAAEAAAKAAAEKAAAEGKSAAEQAAAAEAARKAAEAKAKAEAEARAAAEAAAKAAAEKAATEKAAAEAKAAAEKAAAEAAAKAAADAAAAAVDNASDSPSYSVIPKTATTYVVKPGDTLSGIASQHGISLEELLDANPKFTTDPKYKGGSMIWSGTTVKIPGGGSGGGSGGGFGMQMAAMGGLINPMKFAFGGFAKGTDTVPAMLTPGEFVMSKYAVDAHGVNTMKAINSGQPTGGAVYNNTYTLTVNAKTNANPNEIAQAVMSTIKQVDDRRIRGIGINGR
jgi:LysM repeat protein